MDRLFKTLGDENRLRIVNLLRKGKLCVCELESILNASQSNISRHLTKLRNDSIVVYEKKSQWTYYEINPKFIENNSLLYKYLVEKMDCQDPFIKDLTRLSSYRKSGMSCSTLQNKR